ncbi:MAG: cysteine desulfurase family protein [Pseudomonadota bacterium]
MIYLDHNGTTPIAPEAALAMRPFLEGAFGNPSSDYDLGRTARTALEEARARVAELIGAAPDEVVFTSGGTESDNWALKGPFFRSEGPFHLIASRIEHPAVINPALFLMTLGAKVDFVRVGPDGAVDPEEVRGAIRPETKLISIMTANNETGVLQPLEAISRLARDRGILLHTDAAQAVGKIPLDVERLGVDLLTVAGHKLYAPKGVGALYIRRGLELEPLLHGAGQESGRRAGTENVLLAVGLGAAAEVCRRSMAVEAPRQAALRDRLVELIARDWPSAVLVGRASPRLPNTVNICFPGLIGAELLARTPEIRASTGAACHAGEVRISPVLGVMGLSSEVAGGAARLSLGRSTTAGDVDLAAAGLIRAARELAGRRG